MHFCGLGICFDGVALTLSCFIFSLFIALKQLMQYTNTG